MAQNNIQCALCADKSLTVGAQSASVNQGENKTTALVVSIPEQFASGYNFALEFYCPHGRSYRTPTLTMTTDEELGNVITYEIESCITSHRGLVLVQLTARDTTDSTICFKSQKSDSTSFFVNESINSDNNAFVMQDLVADANAKLAEFALLKSQMNSTIAECNLKKNAYEYAVEGGYAGSEADFEGDMATLASKVSPTTLNQSLASALDSVKGSAWDSTLTLVSLSETKQPKNLVFSSVEVAANAFVADTSNEGNASFADYPFRATVALTGANASMVANVVLSLADAVGGKIAPICETIDGGLYLYATEANASAITIPTIVVEVA